MSKKSVIIMIVFLAILVAGIYIMSNLTVNDPVKTDEQKISVNTKLYFSDESAGYLTAENISYTVNSVDEKYIYVIKKLIEGPTKDGRYPAINSKTVVNKVSVYDKICTVDFSNSFLEYNAGGSLREMLCVYSVVNTLCEFDEIESVVFTVDGKKIETFGQMDMTEPYKKDKSLVK